MKRLWLADLKGIYFPLRFAHLPFFMGLVSYSFRRRLIMGALRICSGDIIWRLLIIRPVSIILCCCAILYSSLSHPGLNRPEDGLIPVAEAQVVVGQPG